MTVSQDLIECPKADGKKQLNIEFRNTKKINHPI